MPDRVMPQMAWTLISAKGYRTLAWTELSAARRVMAAADTQHHFRPR